MIEVTTNVSAENDDVTITIRTNTESHELGEALLRVIRQEAATIRLIHNGKERFFGPPSELAALSYDLPGLAGEHSIERSVRMLTKPEPPNELAPAARPRAPIVYCLS